MKLVIFGLTVSSSWGNGHATLWRGLIRALAARGHDVTVTFCYTSEHRGMVPHYTSQPADIGAFVDFGARMVRRYGR